MGFAAGILSLGLRTRGLGIEAAFYAVAGIQAAAAAIAVAVWGMSLLRERWRRNRLLRERDAQLRVVDSVPHTT
jgi:hypothetical protein